MKIIVMGAGVAGVSSAWYLAEHGHEVTVIDRQSAPAMETSFANAGQLSFGYTTPWAAPGIPRKALKWLSKSHSPLIMRPDGSLDQATWMVKMLANCTQRRYKINKAKMTRLSTYSREMFKHVIAQTGIEFEHRQQGLMQVFRSQQEVDAVQADMKVLTDYGVAHALIEPDQILEYEPGLAQSISTLKAALHLPHDETGDCYLFTTRLAAKCRERGVKFIFDHDIESIAYEGNAITGLVCGQQRYSADHYVCALGSHSHQLLKSIQLNVPVYPVKGYSITMPIHDAANAPQSTVLDEKYKVAITRFDQRIRVGGMAELSGYTSVLHPKHKETLLMVVNDLFPDGGDAQQLSYWSGLRSMTPDSVPIIGANRYKNLSLNIGHGTLGWTMSQGCAKLVADLISGVSPDIEYQDLAFT